MAKARPSVARALQRFAVFGFATTHEALRAERALKDAGLPVVPIPPPHSLGALCGIAMRVPANDAQEARLTLAETGISVQDEGVIDDFGPPPPALT